MQKERSEGSKVLPMMEINIAHSAVQSDKYGGKCNSLCMTDTWKGVLLRVGGSDQSQRTHSSSIGNTISCAVTLL
jgi:hypothetical protein